MKGFHQLTMLMLGLLLLLQQEFVSAGYSMNDTCQHYWNGHIGDPTDCQSWGYCQNGVLTAKGKCKPGYLYDMSQGICNYAANVNCRTNIDNICANIETPQFIPDPNNCQSYCYCANKRAECTTCPLNQVFNPNTNTCVYKTKYNCPSNSICQLVPNNKFAADPQVCGNYIRCVDGSGMSTKCKPGYTFNPLVGACDPKYTCNGSGTGNGNADNGHDGFPPDSLVCQKGYTGPKTTYVTDSKTCYGYYVCTSQGGPGTWGKCPYGMHFNPKLQTCVTPFTYACPYDRCGNMNLPFVANLGCESYTICNNGVAGSKGTCNTVNSKYPYFNEYGGGCVVEKPNYGVCGGPPKLNQ